MAGPDYNSPRFARARYTPYRARQPNATFPPPSKILCSHMTRQMCLLGIIGIGFDMANSFEAMDYGTVSGQSFGFRSSK